MSFKCDDESWDDDDPCLCCTTFDQANTDTIIGLFDIKVGLSRYKLTSYKHDAPSMLELMQYDYQEIIDAINTHEDYLLHTFQALLIMTNVDFKLEIK